VFSCDDEHPARISSAAAPHAIPHVLRID